MQVALDREDNGFFSNFWKECNPTDTLILGLLTFRAVR